VHTGEPQHARQFVLVSALVILVSQHGHKGNANVLQYSQHAAHLLRRAVILKIPRDLTPPPLDLVSGSLSIR